MVVATAKGDLKTGENLSAMVSHRLCEIDKCQDSMAISGLKFGLAHCLVLRCEVREVQRLIWDDGDSAGVLGSSQSVFAGREMGSELTKKFGEENAATGDDS
jgi:predicted homoserine dehydrogenase-like protein